MLPAPRFLVLFSFVSDMFLVDRGLFASTVAFRL